MAFAANSRGQREVIDLTSDDSDNEGPAMSFRRPAGFANAAGDDEYMAFVRSPPRSPPGPAMQPPSERRPPQPERAQSGIFVDIDGENVFIPDEDIDEPAAGPAAYRAADANILRDQEIAMGLQQPEQPLGDFQRADAPRDENTARDREVAQALENQTVTAHDCLQRVLEIFPDISHEHVHKLYNNFGEEDDYESLPGQARLDNIIEQLVSASSYPKQERNKLKRKRESTIDENPTKKWEDQDRALAPNALAGPMRSILKAEFPDVPNAYIAKALKENRHLYQTYVELAKAGDVNDKPYGRGRPSSNLANADTIALNCGWPEMTEELKAARAKVQASRLEKAVEKLKQQQEKENLERAIAAGEISECSACFDELPMNRQIHCNGPVAHFTCYDCALTYIKTEIGESRCRVLCTAGCGANFATAQLNQLSDKQLLEKLAQLQQEKDIRDAGLDDLEECPFCDYKAILPPVEEDFEFRCANPECEKTSCRRCKALSHIPISCEQHAKNNKVNSRHKIEEAMTAALIRSCNQCKKTFIKDFGCNKMRCPSCNNMQCYVCSASLKDYNHFDQNTPGSTQSGAKKAKCPLYDNVEERHEREVKEAGAAARAQVVSENPDVSVEDLEIKVSDAVKKATADRIKQAGRPGGAAPDDFLFARMADFDAHPVELDHQRRLAAAMARQQAVQLNAQRAQRTAQDLRVIEAQLQAQRAEAVRLRQAAAQAAPQAERNGGLFGPLQGYIPVFWNPPAAAPEPQLPQQQLPAAPPAQQQHQAQPNNAAGGRRGFNLGDYNPFRFGGDGAADFGAAPLPQAPANIDLNNDNHFGGNLAFRDFNRPVPGAYPIQPQGDQQRDPQLRELDNMRRQHEQRLQLRQQGQARANPPGRQHYRDYEQQMRRMGGFPPGQ